MCQIEVRSNYVRATEWMLDGRRFSGNFSDGQNKTMVDCRDMRHDTDIGVWERRWSSMLPLFAGTNTPA